MPAEDWAGSMSTIDDVVAIGELVGWTTWALVIGILINRAWRKTPIDD